jgi:cobalamin-dependent methionine synthase I
MERQGFEIPLLIGGATTSREIEADLATLARYIDWTPYFASWDLVGPLSDDPRG